MITKGFKFGMLLQIAVGPVCIYIFNESVKNGILSAFVGVIAVVLIDALFIGLSIVGISAIVKKKEQLLKIFGSLVLVTFGLRMIISALQITEFNSINITEINYIKTFLTVLFLTVSNPLTIIFWSGVFSTKIIEEKFDKNDEIMFGLGAIFSTFLFLNFIVIIGQFTKSFLSLEYIMYLNIIVGLVLIYFGLKLVLKPLAIKSIKRKC
jgi:threonine/homoserine/homoserine lactone efflux protein